MPLRLDEISPNKGAQLTRPREIYASVQGRRWSRLRPEQNEVLEKWYDRRVETDLVIKQNTGGGKTLTGLLVAQSSLHEGVGPAVYLVPDRFLIEQVVGEAEAAKIAVVRSMDDEAFRASKAILVTTFQKLLNGRSAFGVRGVKPVIPLGTVIVDDAHAAINASGGIFAASVPSSHPVFKKLLKLFATDLKQQSPKGFQAIVNGEFGAPIRVPPKAVADRADALLALVDPVAAVAANTSLFYSWPFVADSLRFSVVTFTASTVEIRMPCPEVALIPAFRLAKRRVYLTATLEDEGVLVTELDADADAVRKPITPDQASDIGDRLILAPRSLNPQIEDAAVRDLARRFADGERVPGQTSASINVVVLVPSDRAAERWSSIADHTLHVTDMRPVIERMKAGEHLGVVVLVNKYDGVDLPGDACRLLIIDGVPTPLTPHEQRASSALHGSASFKAREVQRIEQGMGRGIRDDRDHCAVLVLGSSAALSLRDSTLRRFYSPATRAQIELSQQVSDQIEGEGLAVVAEVLDTFLTRDPSWVTKSLEATADVKYSLTGNVPPLAEGRRTAFNRALAGDFDGAVTTLRESITTVDDPLEKGWALEELAAYQHHVDDGGAQATLSAAHKLNTAVLKPATSLTRKKLAGPVVQASSVAERLAGQFDDARSLELAVGAIFDNVVWGLEEAADLAEEQFRELGALLGFASSRPEKELRDGGPDNLWALTPTAFAVLELKTGVSRPHPVIEKSEAEQIVHSITWFRDHYGEEAHLTAVLVHPSHQLDTKAHLPKGTRVMTQEDFERLRQQVLGLTRKLAGTDQWGDQTFVAAGLAEHDLAADRLLARHTRPFA